MRAKSGDVFEINTRNGFGFFQLTHIHSKPPKMGALIRVLGEFPDAQRNADALAVLPTRFKTFFPVNAALTAGVIRRVGRAPIPQVDQAFPLFRNGVRDPKTKAVAIWWLWDGEKEWKVGTLAEEQFDFPLLQVINDTLLADRIADGWEASDYR